MSLPFFINQPKKRHFLTGFLVLALLHGCGYASVTTPGARDMAAETSAVYLRAEFDLFLERYYQDSLKLFPMNATYAGDHRYNHLLNNELTSEFQTELKSHFETYQRNLERYEKNELLPEQRLSYDILQWEVSIGLEGLEFPFEYLPIDQFWTHQLTIGQWAMGSGAQPFRNKQDYDNWLSRIDVFVEWCDSAIANMREAIKTGIVLPRSLSIKVIPQLAAWADGTAQEHHFYLPAKNIPASISVADAQEIRASYTSMVDDKLKPAIKRLHGFFVDEYLPAGRKTSGIDSLPNGSEWYQYQIKYYTTTDITPDEVFRLGKSEVERLRAEMEKVKTQMGFAGDLSAFFDHVRESPDLMPFREPQQVIDNFNAIHEKMKPNLKRLFDHTPTTDFEVRRTEAFREASASAEYSSGSLDGTRPGIFYVPIPDVATYNTYSDEDLFLHEAIPGHHYQVSLAQENANLPSFRKTLWYSAYGEGWALYSESLGKELGLYDDAYQYFGMLGAEMHRAIRLVVDAGLHSQGWTREQAIQYSLDNEAESEASIISEIERYMAGPGQALSYKIGQLKIRELRSKAELKLGDKFDIREFHNKVLESGIMPLKLLETKVNAWIDR